MMLSPRKYRGANDGNALSSGPQGGEVKKLSAGIYDMLENYKNQLIDESSRA